MVTLTIVQGTFATGQGTPTSVVGSFATTEW